MKTLLLRILRTLLIFATTLALAAQATFTPPVPPTGAVPGKLVAIAGTGASAINCTLTGDTVPAKAIVFNCSLGGVVIPSFTLPIPASSTLTAFTFQLNSGTNAATVILSLKPNTTAGIDIQATVNAQPAVTGTF